MLAEREYSSGQVRERDRDRDREGDRRGGGRFFRKKVCRFCSEKVSLIDFKDIERLSKFLTEKGKIISRRITGNCAKHQRALARAIKRARHAVLIPFQAE
ncbi:MAG: 30S ribosomal protein S18 [Candidatus Omnitrophica bacterium]|nr:30S ribosomal protein S18 [Candidatus Omnitrophota bacterium]